MPRAKRTKADREREAEEAQRLARQKFMSKLEAVQGYDEARRLVDEGDPGNDKPGHHLYANLHFLLNYFTTPGGADREELRLYLQLVPRFRTGVKPEFLEALKKVEADLHTAITR